MDNRRTKYERRSSSNVVSFPFRNSSGILITADHRINCDRRKKGFVLTESEISQQEFIQYFNKFEEENSAELKNMESDQNRESLGMCNYHLLYRKDAECPFLLIHYLETSDDHDSDLEPALYVFGDGSLSRLTQTEIEPLQVYNIHGKEAYKKYIEYGWVDITHETDTFPLVIKYWLENNYLMKQTLA